MKILVFGAGPLGSLKAVRLHEAGHDVYLLARGQRLADLKEHGIVIQEEGADGEEVAHVPVVRPRVVHTVLNSSEPAPFDECLSEAAG